jgi:hypothetical protein
MQSAVCERIWVHGGSEALPFLGMPKTTMARFVGGYPIRGGTVLRARLRVGLPMPAPAPAPPANGCGAEVPRG